MPNKKVSSTISQDFLVVKLLMATFIVGVFFNLYLFAVHPPWMEQIHSFFESDRPEYRKSKWQTKDEVFRSFLAISIANACMSALLWFLGYKVCKFMVKRPLKKAGFGSAALARAGSWVFLIPFSGPAAILGLFMCLGAVTSGTRAPMGPLEFTQPYRNNSGPNIFIPPNKGRRKGI
ncbi:hypothetical protein N9228_00215 [bacterium]|nr:hypothetical protein [Akkermansiaceae bacterium]MDA7630182.1 hypothetical protein [bacterium]MDA7624499.1 hypothetical protein [Akkermansiaceae bacterium]MDA7626035.1 hypothetical protein [Akkermansiaceae bacterium]MDA7789921.1 hypothetical protein [Akkermansiaceae bacterium]